MVHRFPEIRFWEKDLYTLSLMMTMSMLNLEKLFNRQTMVVVSLNLTPRSLVDKVNRRDNPSQTITSVIRLEKACLNLPLPSLNRSMEEIEEIVVMQREMVRCH